jgi:hypothetical protein
MPDMAHDRVLISPTPFPRSSLRFRELQAPRVVDGKTVFVIERVSLRKMAPFWLQRYVKAHWRDYLLIRANRRASARGKKRHA